MGWRQVHPAQPARRSLLFVPPKLAQCSKLLFSMLCARIRVVTGVQHLRLGKQRVGHRARAVSPASSMTTLISFGRCFC